jgi:hypothetical protein
MRISSQFMLCAAARQKQLAKFKMPRFFLRAGMPRSGQGFACFGASNLARLSGIDIHRLPLSKVGVPQELGACLLYSSWSHRPRSIGMLMKSSLQVVVLLMLFWGSVCEASGATYAATLMHPIGFGWSSISAVGETSAVGVGNFGGDPRHRRALMWNDATSTIVNLHPANYFESFATDAYGDTQVGVGFQSDDNRNFALMWSGTAASVVDLHPNGYYTSSVVAAANGIQAGAGQATNTSRGHALLWRGTAASVVDLHPVGFSESSVSGASGEFQVGTGWPSSLSAWPRALLWRGTKESVVELHPPSMRTSNAYDVWENVQVGMVGDASHESLAYVWKGTAASGISIHPPQMFSSVATALSGAGIVGVGTTVELREYLDIIARDQHALVWPAGSSVAIDLHPALAATGIDAEWSYAAGIDEQGQIFGTAQKVGGGIYAVRWSPIPEPRALLGFVILAISLVGQRRWSHCIS